jgi:pSer/pThr/pTyr-binding forkhead associated (FHA) protein
MVTKCPNCGRENREEERVCVYCGTLLDAKPKSTTRSLDDTDYEEGAPKWGVARVGPGMILRLDAADTQQHFNFDVEHLDSITLGRLNPDTGERPDVDLTATIAQDRGVSRNHAFIKLLEGALYVIDNNSANGTYVNGQKLVAQKPRIIRDGDDIRLGRLVVRVSFLKKQT